MKKRLVILMLSGVLAFGQLAGCGSSTDQGNTQIQENDQTQETAKADEEQIDESAEAAQSAAEAEPEEETNPYKTLNISDWGYKKMWYLNKDYLMVDTDDKYVIINSSTGERAFANVEFSSVTLQCQDGRFIGNVKKDGKIISSSIYYIDGNTLTQYQDIGDSGWKFVNYRDGIAVIDKGDSDYPYMLATFGSDGMIRYGNIFAETQPYISYDYIIFLNNKFWKDKEALDWVDDASDVKAFIDKEGIGRRAELKIAEQDGTVKRTPLAHDGKALRFSTLATPNDEGWADAFLRDDTLKRGSKGFYNVKTGEFIEWTLTDSVLMGYFTADNGSTICAVTDGKAKNIFGKDDNNNPFYRIFDLKTKNWATEETYYYVGPFGYRKYVLVRSMDGKWGYIDNEDMSETEWFDDASDFCNGYAVVINGGKAHLINEKFEQVSEEFDALGASVAQQDYLEYSDLDGKAVFFVTMSDGLKHLLTVE